MLAQATEINRRKIIKINGINCAPLILVNRIQITYRFQRYIDKKIKDDYFYKVRLIEKFTSILY